MPKHILVATLGGSWEVIPEIIGFTNPKELPLYQASSQQSELARQCKQHHLTAVEAAMSSSHWPALVPLAENCPNRKR
ncbi:MAG: hypothetical protein Kow0060_19190 [Methylohalobius crimeensis]